MPIPAVQAFNARRRRAAAPDDPDPPPDPPAFPAGPHIRLVSAHGASVVRAQDGATADVRLVRPVYPFTHILSVTSHNSAASPSNRPYWGDRHGFLDTQSADHLSVNRELLSTDDGDHPTHIYQEMSDGSVLSLAVALSVAPTATGAAPSPTPVPNPPLSFAEEFTDARRGTGALYVNFASVRNTGNGTVIIEGVGSAHQPFSPTFTNDGLYGLPAGRFQYRSRYIGPDIGSGSGPCQLLWPGDDRWNSVDGYNDEWLREIDLGELMPDGTFYFAEHWTDRNAHNGDANAIWAVKDNPTISPGGVFDHQAWHTYAVDTFPDMTVYRVDGHVLAVSDRVAPDFANGGVNRGFGILCNSPDRGLEVDHARWWPIAGIARP